MNDDVLELAESCVGSLEETFEAIYKAAYNQALDDAAKIFEAQGFPLVGCGYAARAIRELEKK